MQSSVNAIQKKIGSYFLKSKKRHSVQFKQQGSFATGTIVNPLPDSDYDIDIGVYISSKTEDEPSTKSLHDWIFKGIDFHTEEVIDKNTCIRAVYSSSEGVPEFHIDFPVYWVSKDGTPYFAHKTEGYKQSDPIAFINWFEARCDNGMQLKRIVKYVKAWSDCYYTHMPKGIILTVLCANNYVENARDDIALFQTLKGIEKALTRENKFECNMPTAVERENLFEIYGATDQTKFLERLATFIQKAEDAIMSNSSMIAYKKWKTQFKERFPSNP